MIHGLRSALLQFSSKHCHTTLYHFAGSGTQSEVTSFISTAGKSDFPWKQQPLEVLSCMSKLSSVCYFFINPLHMLLFGRPQTTAQGLGRTQIVTGHMLSPADLENYLKRFRYVCHILGQHQTHYPLCQLLGNCTL